MRQVFLFLALIWVAIAGSASAQSNRVDTEYSSSIAIPEKTALVPGETIWIAFAQELAEGWHVYWKNPGDSGLPLEFNWVLPDGLSAGDIVYPTPEHFPIGPLANFGHHGSPVFLAPISISENMTLGETVELTLQASWLICEEICVPEDGSFSFSLPVAASAEDLTAGADAVARARLVTPVPFTGTATFAASNDALILSLDQTLEAGGEAFFFPEAEGLIEHAAAQKVAIVDGRTTITMTPGFSYDPGELETIKGIVGTTASKAIAGFELTATEDPNVAGASGIAAAPIAPVESAGGGNVPLLLAAAFFGGILLNIMPCVFPIIFVKAASLMHSAQSERGVIRRHGILYTVGVVATFAAIGGLLLLLRASGEQLGWGFHLQSPVIVALSAYVLFLVGLNLAGVFEIGESLMGAGGGLADKGGDIGAFFTGMLAVVVAAPCIGPLLSAPMGAAVFLPPFWGMMIFVLMALGLAAPYLLLSFVPALGRMLPKPGAWMKIFKQFLSFPVFAAAAYFLWVLAQQSGGTGLATALIGAVFLAFAAWLFGLSKGDGRSSLFVRAGAAVAAVIAIAPITQIKIAAPVTAQAGEAKHGALQAIAYSETMLETYRAEGRSVFIDFTAAWCVTCQFNKATIFSKASIAKAFEEKDVVVMVADWTLRDPEITKALEAFGANGVPLYVYYGSAQAPQVLSLPLTEKAVMDVVTG